MSFFSSADEAVGLFVPASLLASDARAIGLSVMSTGTSTTPTMFSRNAARTLSQARQFSSSAARQSKVTVLGAGGGIGQPLSLLLKLNPLVTELSLYDIRGGPGMFVARARASTMQNNTD